MKWAFKLSKHARTLRIIAWLGRPAFDPFVALLFTYCPHAGSYRYIGRFVFRKMAVLC